MRKSFGVVVAALLVTGGLARAQAEAPPADAAPPPMPAPAPEAVKAVWDFFYKGKGSGLVLADAKLCLEVAKAGDNKFECAQEVPAEGVKVGTVVSVWQAYLLPQGDVVEDVMVQLKQGDVVRETKDVSLKGEGFRTRTWPGFRIPKAGSWTIAVVRGGETLKSLTLNAFK